MARRAMVERGLEPEFPGPAMAQLAQIRGAGAEAAGVRDLRSLLWCSIDNDDSRDLDQLSVCEELAAGSTRLLVAIADVDTLVKKGTPLDEHAEKNTTSVYTAAQVFPMLPERLSTDLTSLNPDVDRAAIVIAYLVDAEGKVSGGTIERALVHNFAQLAYDSTAPWLEGSGPLPERATRVAGLDRQLRAQDEAAQRLRKRRLEQGALELQSIEPKALFEGDKIVGLRAQEQNRARQLIEELMVGANGIAAGFLEKKGSPSLRRIVRSPERWQKIVAVAAERGTTLPGEPDSRALEGFLKVERAKDPLRFPDLSLVIVKLMGRGEYVAEAPGQTPIGHFGLAVRDYSHTTAPNRRFPDLITHRLLKAALDGQKPPYPIDELGRLAARCTEMEAAATKVERQVRKSAAVLVLQDRIGEVFDGFVTGAADKGTFVRILAPPVEGRIIRGESGLRVGDKVRVSLLATDFEKGFIDFGRAR